MVSFRRAERLAGRSPLPRHQTSVQRPDIAHELFVPFIREGRFQATQEIRRREVDGQHLPIIAMTAGAPEQGREKCIAASMDDYLSKPLSADRLEVILQR